MNLLSQKIKPMLAKRAKAPFNSKDWIYEVKFDGTRALLFFDGSRYWIQNRRLLDITYRYPELFVQSSEENFILDGEIVVFWEGKPDFYRLQEREHAEKLKAEILAKLYPATYMVFDLLYLNGRSLLNEPIEKRKELLTSIDLGNKNFVLVDFVREKGKEYFENAVKLGLEGVMAKKLGTPYLPGKRVDFWLKFKKENEEDLVIVGYMVGEGERKDLIGSLLCAKPSGRGLRFVARVGTGFDKKLLAELKEKLDKLRVDKAPVENPPKLPRPVVWVEPKLICTVKYLEKTPGSSLRAPVFVRLREDKTIGDLLDEVRE